IVAADGAGASRPRIAEHDLELIGARPGRNVPGELIPLRRVCDVSWLGTQPAVRWRRRAQRIPATDEGLIRSTTAGNRHDPNLGVEEVIILRIGDPDVIGPSDDAVAARECRTGARGEDKRNG